jgi:pimeloyl-ACP methyl ester carboxylesterase
VKIKNVPVIMIQGDRDLLVRVTMVRPLAEKMKELEMDVEYIEVKGGGHIAVAFDNLPRIFEFFNKRTRSR